MQVKSKSGRVFDLPSDAEDNQIQSAIQSDPNTLEVTDFSNMKPLEQTAPGQLKDRVNIRLSKEITEYFRSTGKGWQTRMNDVLLEYVRSH